MSILAVPKSICTTSRLYINWLDLEASEETVRLVKGGDRLGSISGTGQGLQMFCQWVGARVCRLLPIGN